MLRGLRIWLFHGLAFLAGMIVSAVVASGLMVLAPGGGPAVIAVAAVGLTLGYLVWAALVCLLLDMVAGPVLRLVGPGLLIATMLAYFALIYWGVATPTEGSVLIYLLLFLAGGFWLSFRPEEWEE